jgi:hypothetical protein
VLDLTALHHQLGHVDVVPARVATGLTARWLVENSPEPGGAEEMVLTDPFDYANEDRLIESWLAARRSVHVPDFPFTPNYGLAFSGPTGRPRTQKEFLE